MPDSATGDVAIYLAGPSGAVIEADRALVEAAILVSAAPLCITPTVTSATAVAVPITYELWLYSSVGATTAQIEAAIEAALGTMIAARPIGGDRVGATGGVYHSLIEATIKAVYPEQVFDVAVTTPTGNTVLALSEVPTLGTVTATAINLVADP